MSEDELYVRDLLAAVGEVFLTWGFLESALLAALGGSSRTPVIQRWLQAADPEPEIFDALKDAAAIRHLLAHGLCAVHARPPHGGEAEVVCRDPDDGEVRITMGRLREVSQTLDRLRLKIAAAARSDR